MNCFCTTKRFGISLLLTLAAFSLLLGGCGASGGPDAQTQAKSVEQVKGLRTYFDKAQGDYGQLTDVDKAEYIKLAGGDAKGQQYWKLMKEGPDAARGTGTTGK